jgi:peptidoglycan/xylan/chitin deacetylase (PgdA/CDA1 family)
MVKRFLGSAKRFLLNRIDTPALVLLYHRVTRLQKDPQLLAVSPENFYEQVNHLRGTYSLLQIEEFYDLLSRRKKFPRKTVVLTFDDGYADNLLEALPILQSLNSQALFYITTSNLDTDRELWWDELERIFLGNHSLPPFLEIEHKDGHIQLDTRTHGGRTDTYNFMHPLLRFAAPAERNRILDHLRAMTGLSASGRPSHRMLTSVELQQLSRSSSAVIGAHTHNHPSLAVLPYKQQLEEMSMSKNMLEKITGNTMQHFSYPYGSKRDYNRDSINACREMGFKMVCSNFYGQVHSWTDPLQVPRVLIRDWNKQQFSQYLSKFFSY